MKCKVTLLQFPVSTLPWSRMWGWGREITPSVNTHPHYTIVLPVSSSPTQCGEVFPVTSPSFHHPCHCTVTLLSLPFSCPCLLSFFGQRKWYRRHLCLWLVFRVGGLCLQWEKVSVVLLPFALWCFWLVFVQCSCLYRWKTASVFQRNLSGRVKKTPLIGLALRRIV